jgi:hypothetical protein
MAKALGDEKASAAASALEAKARASLNDRYWIESAGHHAFGILRSGRTNDTLTVWPATAAAFGLLDEGRAERTLAQLAGHALTSDWGARMLTTESPLYDPTHYNMGAVWPFVTGFLAWGHYNYGRPFAGFPLIEALASTGFDWARGRNPEVFSGAYYRPLDEAVPQQFFSTSMVVSPLVSGLLGWDPDAPRGRARLAPQLPPQWPAVRLSGLRVGSTTLDVRLEQSAAALVARFHASGPGLRLDFAPALPAGARDVRATLDGKPVPVKLEANPRYERARLDLAPSGQDSVATLEWKGGLSVEPPVPTLEPGQTDGGLRVVDFLKTSRGWALTLEGLSGREYELALHGERPRHVTGAERLPSSAGPDVMRLKVVLPEATARTASVTVTLDR